MRPRAPALSGTATGSMWNLLGAIVTAIASLGAVWLVSTNYSHEETGALLTAVAIMTMAASSAKLGVEATTTWYTATAIGSGDDETIAAVVAGSLRRVLVLSLAAAVLVAGTAPVLGPLVVDDLVVPTFARTLAVLATAVPMWAVAQASHGVSRGFGTMKVAVLAGSIIRPAVLLVATASLVGAGAPIWAIGASWTIAGAASLMVSYWWIRRRLGRWGRAPAGSQLRFWRQARPRAAADVLHAVLDRLDIVLLSALAGSAAAADFATAARLAILGQLVLVASSQALAPVVATHIAAGCVEEARAATRAVTLGGVLITWPAMMVVVIHADALVAVFGPAFHGAALLLRIMATAVALMALLGPGDTIVTVLGESRVSLRNHIVALAIQAATICLLVPMVGGLGAALAWSAARLGMRALSSRLISQRLGSPWIHRASLAAAVLVTVMVAPIGILVLRFGPSGLAGAATTAAIVGSVLVTGAASLVPRSLSPARSVLPGCGTGFGRWGRTHRGGPGAQD